MSRHPNDPFQTNIKASHSFGNEVSKNRRDFMRDEFKINQLETKKRNPTFERSKYDHIQSMVYP